MIQKPSKVNREHYYSYRDFWVITSYNYNYCFHRAQFIIFRAQGSFESLFLLFRYQYTFTYPWSTLSNKMSIGLLGAFIGWIEYSLAHFTRVRNLLKSISISAQTETYRFDRYKTNVVNYDDDSFWMIAESLDIPRPSLVSFPHSKP